jgi:serine/threonine protein kinase
MALTRGTRVGPYLVEGRIGAGGMGEVHRATDTRLGRAVALKVLREGTASDPERVHRFEREARAAATVNHPNIIVLYDVGTHQGAPYLVTELLEGHTLREELAAGVPWSKVLAYGAQLAAALRAAHERGVVHRDLKPDNLFVTTSGTLKVLDFGIARLEDTTSGTQTSTGAVLGTAGYMAPEQVRGQGADHRADLFAAGCILYELAGGKRAFAADTSVETGYAVLNTEPSPLPSSVPPAFGALVARCLEKSVEQRLASAAELEEALAALASGARIPKARRRFPLQIAAAALLAAVALGTAGVVGRRLLLSGVPLTEQRIPKTTPAAERAYRSALQEMRDGNGGGSWDLFEEAAELDPELASAHLKLALHSATSVDLFKHLAAAKRYPGNLDEREQAMLPLAELLVQKPRAPEAILVAARELTDRYPRDVEAQKLLLDALTYQQTDEAQTLRQIDRLLELDPHFAGGYLSRWNIHYEQNQFDLALSDADTCIAFCPRATSCMRERMKVEAARGQCKQLEVDARRAVQIAPHDERLYDWLARALAANEAPLESIQVLQAQRIATMPKGNRRDEEQQLSDLRVALLVGDFPAAQHAAEEIERLRANELSELAHDQPYEALISIAVEQGDDAGGLRLADEFERRMPAWQKTGPITRWRRVVLARKLGRIDDDEFEKQRASAQKEDAAAYQPRYRYIADFGGWVTYDAADIEGHDAAVAALARMPPEPIHPPSVDDLIPGVLMQEAGRSAEAVARLKAGCGTCWVFPLADGSWWTETMPWMRAQVSFGDALRDTGDNKGACAAYAVVQRRWKNAKPRSVTLEKAKAHAAALGCPPV